MRVRKFVTIDTEVDIDVDLEDVFAAIENLPEDSKLPWISSAINTAYGVLKRIPENSISQMNDAIRKTIYDALLSQANRFKLRSEQKIAERDENNNVA